MRVLECRRGVLLVEGADVGAGRDDLVDARLTRRRRADAERNLSALLESAKAVFASSGVDAPAKEITDAAGLHDYVAERLEPVVADLLADARTAGEIESDLDARELLYAVGLLCQPVPAAGFDFDYNRRMAMVFIEGLRRAA